MIAIANKWQGYRSLGVLYMLAWKNQNLKIRRGKVKNFEIFLTLETGINDCTSK